MIKQGTWAQSDTQLPEAQHVLVARPPAGSLQNSRPPRYRRGFTFEHAQFHSRVQDGDLALRQWKLVECLQDPK